MASLRRTVVAAVVWFWATAVRGVKRAAFALGWAALHCAAVNVLAIDQGTSSTKALVVSPAGAVLSEAEVPVHPHVTADGGVEQDAEELWQSVLEAGRQAITRSGAPIAALGLANQGETVLAWDRATGRPLSIAISWQDRRALSVCDALRAHEQSLQSLTGLPLDPYFAAPKMRWLRERVTRDGVCTTTDTWLLHRLCGVYVTDAATASRTLLLDLDAVSWSATAATHFDIDPNALPAIAPCAGVVGRNDRVRRSAAGRGHCGRPAARLRRAASVRETKCTYGTARFSWRPSEHAPGVPRRGWSRAWRGSSAAKRPTAWTGRSTPSAPR
jgi:glycerol kinase